VADRALQGRQVYREQQENRASKACLENEVSPACRVLPVRPESTDPKVTKGSVVSADPTASDLKGRLGLRDRKDLPDHRVLVNLDVPANAAIQANQEHQVCVETPVLQDLRVSVKAVLLLLISQLAITKDPTNKFI